MVGIMLIFCGKSEGGSIYWPVESGYTGLEGILKITLLEMLLIGGEYLITYQIR